MAAAAAAGSTAAAAGSAEAVAAAAAGRGDSTEDLEDDALKKAWGVTPHLEVLLRPITLALALTLTLTLTLALALTPTLTLTLTLTTCRCSCAEITATCVPGVASCASAPTITPTTAGVCYTIKFPDSAATLVDFHATINTAG